MENAAAVHIILSVLMKEILFSKIKIMNQLTGGCCQIGKESSLIYTAKFLISLILLNAFNFNEE